MDTPAEEAMVRVELLRSLMQSGGEKRVLSDTARVDGIIDGLQLAAEALTRSINSGGARIDRILDNYDSKRAQISQYSSVEEVLGAVCQDIVALAAVVQKHDIVSGDLAMPVHQLVSQMSNTFGDLGVRNSCLGGAIPDRIMEAALTSVIGIEASEKGDVKSCLEAVVNSVSKKGLEINPVLSKFEVTLEKTYAEQKNELETKERKIVEKYGDYGA